MPSLSVVLILFMAADPQITPAPWTPCSAGSLSDKAADLMKPILKERGAAEEDAREDRSLDESPHFWESQKQLYALMGDKSENADAALAGLVHIYLGEAAGGDLQCEIIHRGQRMLKYLKRFQSCMPSVPGVSIPLGLIDHLPNQYPDLIHAIETKETCEPN